MLCLQVRPAEQGFQYSRLDVAAGLALCGQPGQCCYSVCAETGALLHRFPFDVFDARVLLGPPPTRGPLLSSRLLATVCSGKTVRGSLQLPRAFDFPCSLLRRSVACHDACVVLWSGSSD